jgi:hypothetical protein
VLAPGWSLRPQQALGVITLPDARWGLSMVQNGDFQWHGMGTFSVVWWGLLRGT